MSPQDVQTLEDPKQESEAPEAPEYRVLDANAGRGIYNQLRTDHDTLDRNLGLMRGLLDGNPPVAPQKLKQKNQEDRTNVNYREMEGIVTNYLSAYHDLLNATRKLVDVELMVSNLDPDLKYQWECIIAEEMSTTMKQWKSFAIEMMLHQLEMVFSGMGPIHFDHPTNWHFTACARASVWIQPGTKLGGENMDYLVIKDTMAVTELYRLVRNMDFETEAEGSGWDPKRVKKILIGCAKKQYGLNGIPEAYGLGEWTGIQENIRSNDIGWAADKEDIAIFHLYVREYDGSITHHIVDTLGTGKEWLYRKRNAYEDWHQCVHFFLFEVMSRQMRGAKGLGHKAYNGVKTNNRLLCHLVDAAFQHATLVFQGTAGEADVTRRRLFHIGPRMVVPPGIEFKQSLMGTSMEGPLSIVNVVGQRMRTNFRVDQINRDALGAGGQSQSVEQLRQEAMREADVERSKISWYYTQEDWLMEEIFRRMTLQTRGPGDTSEDESDAFVQRCVLRGVPQMVIDPAYVNVRAARAIGFGSASARKRTYYELAQLKPEMDEAGRRNLNRDIVVDAVGMENADRYYPLQDRDRLPSTQTTLVALENLHLQEGEAVPVGIDQPHATHFRLHAQDIMPVMERVQQGQVVPEPQMTQRLFAWATAWLQHTDPHVQAMRNDPTREREYEQAVGIFQSVAAWRKQLEQQLGLIRQRMQQEAEQRQQALQEAARDRVGEAAAKAQADAQQRTMVGLAKVEADREVNLARVQMERETKETDRE